MTDRPKKPRDYEVGYGKPPKHTQWKPGQSGKPSGRPKGATGAKKRSKRMLEALNQVRVGDEVRTMTTHDLALERVREGVRKADNRAISRREFLDGAAKFAVGGLTATALWDMLRPNYALAQQVAKDDKRISAEYTTYPSPKGNAGNGTMRGLLARPSSGQPSKAL